MNTEGFVSAGLGLLDGYSGRAVVVKEAVIDVSGTARADTGLFVPEGAEIVDLKVITGATIPTAATTVMVGHASDDDAFSGAITAVRVANSVATAGDSQKQGRMQALQNVGANTTLYTKLNRSQAGMNLSLQVSYINPAVSEDEAGSSPLNLEDRED